MNSVFEIITRREEEETAESTDSPNLFNNVNISSFNVSFNAGRKSKANPRSSQPGGRKKCTVLQRRVSERRDSSLETEQPLDKVPTPSQSQVSNTTRSVTDRLMISDLLMNYFQKH